MSIFYPTRIVVLALCTLLASLAAGGQSFTKDLPVGSETLFEINNPLGRVDVIASSAITDRAILSATSSRSVPTDSDFTVESTKGRIKIELSDPTPGKRIDISIQVPERSRVRVITREGELRFQGNLSEITATTDTGTVALDIPTVEVRYELLWTASRPRFVADFELEKVKERSGGKFAIKGTHRSPEEELPSRPPITDGDLSEATEAIVDRSVRLGVSTARGIVLLNVPPNEVSSDLRERPLTDAAKAIVRSGDSILMAAIRRAAPKYFGEYERTLPPAERTPSLIDRTGGDRSTGYSELKTARIRVIDANNRAIPDLSSADFQLLAAGKPLDIVSVRPVTSPVNLVLLLDVSGSVDNYVNFIRKAARSFIGSVDANDRVAIVLFNNDIKVLAPFASDKRQLSESLDTFDAGGATAYYDALAYTLADTLRPLRGERTAIVVLTDGDDNRSFLAFDSLAGAIEESGALIYPLYVPTGLIAAEAGSDPARDIDPLRNRHLTLTSKAAEEGPKLAKLSGGVYYPISRLSQIEEAYRDIALQLRTAYEVSFRSAGDTSSSRLRVRILKPGLFASVESVAVK